MRHILEEKSSTRDTYGRRFARGLKSDVGGALGFAGLGGAAGLLADGPPLDFFCH